MTTVTIEMPMVAGCSVSQCAYNKGEQCHARAITVGDGVNAMCDTFFDTRPHSQGDIIAGIGACKVNVCSNNNDYECQAGSVSIGMTSGKASCLTFSAQ